MADLDKGMVSIVVPVYKAAKTIKRCVDSILAQTYTNFELILVDDGTPDNSGKICDEYAQLDSRVKVFHRRTEASVLRGIWALIMRRGSILSL